MTQFANKSLNLCRVVQGLLNMKVEAALEQHTGSIN